MEHLTLSPIAPLTPKKKHGTKKLEIHCRVQL